MQSKLLVGLLVFTLALSVVFSSCAPAAEESYDWKVQYCYVREDPQVEIFQNFIDEVEENSGGRINITGYAEAEIVPVSEVLDAVGKGVVEMGHGQAGYWSGEFPAIQTTSFILSKSWDPVEFYTKIFEDPGDLYAVNEEEYNRANTHFINMVEGGEYPAMYGNAVIRTPEDIKGLKFRFNPPFDKIFERLGAAVTWMPGSEMYMALKLGTLDVATWDCTAYKSMKWQEVAKYYYRPCVLPHFMSTQYFINLDIWKALPQDLKDIITTAGKNQFFDCWDFYADEMQWVTDNAESLGIEIITGDQSLVDAYNQTALQVLLEDVAPLSPGCARGVDIIKTQFLGM